jgi:HSP20 family molecular chaperone IbpA
MSEIKSDLTAAGTEKDAPAATGSVMLPRVDVLEDDTGITIFADLPGVDKGQLTLKTEGDALVIEGEMSPPTPGTLEPVYAEVRATRYRRSFTLSRELDASRTHATLKDGVLSLRIPKRSTAQPQRIKIDVT